MIKRAISAVLSKALFSPLDRVNKKGGPLGPPCFFFPATLAGLWVCREYRHFSFGRKRKSAIRALSAPLWPNEATPSPGRRGGEGGPRWRPRCPVPGRPCRSD